VLAPNTAFGIAEGDRVVGTAASFVYGDNLAWVAMVLTAPTHRGQGIATRLLEYLIPRTPAATLGLDATAEGAPLYRKFGFEDVEPVARYTGTGSMDPSFPSLPPATDFAWDREASGVNRRHLLRALQRDGQSAGLADGSFAFLRPGKHAVHLGPLVAASPESADTLVRWALAQGDGPVFWDLLPNFAPAQDLACHHGFKLARALVRMRRGPQVPASRNAYAIAGFEYG
jgi:hypothetical protein